MSRFLSFRAHSLNARKIIYLYMWISMNSIAMLRFIVHLQFSEIDLSQLLYSFWRVGIIMSKLKNKLYIIFFIVCIFFFYKFAFVVSFPIFVQFKPSLWPLLLTLLCPQNDVAPHILVSSQVSSSINNPPKPNSILKPDGFIA